MHNISEAVYSPLLYKLYKLNHPLAHRNVKCITISSPHHLLFLSINITFKPFAEVFTTNKMTK